MKSRTKIENQEIATISAIDIIESGNASVLTCWIEAKAQIDYWTQLVKELNEEAINERATHGKTAELFGRKLTQVEAGTKYDFKNCNYPPLIAAEEAVKTHKEFLKSTMKMDEIPTIINDDTGEILEINRPIKTSTTTIKISY